VLYDFKDNSFTSYTGRNVKLSTVKAMFSKFGYTINKEESDPVYTKLLGMMKGYGCYNIYNLGTKIERLENYRYTEKWMSQGFVISENISEYDDSKLSKVSKAVKKVYLNNKVDIEHMVNFSDNDKIGVFLEEISNRYDSDMMRNLLEQYKIKYFAEKVKILLTEYKYNPKSLANYICNIRDYEALNLYDDWFVRCKKSR
jgi:hypothetical protein